MASKGQEKAGQGSRKNMNAVEVFTSIYTNGFR